jgi:hypothetical protein
LSDASVAKTVTYRCVTSSYSKTTMKMTETKTDITTRAFVAEIEDIEIPGMAGAFMGANRRFVIRADALANIRPSTKDRIYEDGRWWEIVKIDKTNIGPVPIIYAFYGK